MQSKMVFVTFRNGSGKSFPSMTAAAVALNISTSTVRSRMNEWRPIAGHDEIRKIEWL